MDQAEEWKNQKHSRVSGYKERTLLRKDKRQFAGSYKFRKENLKDDWLHDGRAYIAQRAEGRFASLKKRSRSGKSFKQISCTLVVVDPVCVNVCACSRVKLVAAPDSLMCARR